ncbi:MAG: LytR/AlgR family response regulator transcription factor [Cellulosilyticaceae bacterium]
MLNVVICEDDTTLLEYTAERISSYLGGEDVDYHITCHDHSKSFLEALPSLERHNTVVFLDIDLEREEEGFRLAKKIRGHYGEEVIIIFMTAYSEYVFKCFDYMPLGFIRKKHFEEELGPLLHKVIHKTIKQSKVITFFKTNQGEVKLREHDIIYFEKVGRYVKIKTHADAYEVNYQLSELHDLLDRERFLMIYRSVVVNMDYVSRVERDQVMLEGGEALPLSRYRAKQVKEAFQLYL